MSKNYSLASTRSWSPLALKFVLGFLGLLLSVSSYSQVTYTQGFETNIASWTGGWSRTTSSTPCTGVGQARKNIYTIATAGAFGSPSLGTSNGGLTTFSFSYKIINFSGATATPNTFGSIAVQWGTSSTGPWTTLQTISTGHTPSTSCATVTNTFTPSASSAVFVRMNCTYGTGDYYMIFDNISVTEALPVCSAVVGGSAGSSSTTPCAGTSFTLNATGATSGASGLTYQWYSSPDDVTYSPISGATSTTLVTAALANTYYKREIICAGASTSALSAAVYVTPSAPVATPFTETFSATIPTCWSTSSAGTGAWTFVTADGTNGASAPPAGGGTHFARMDVYNITTANNPVRLNTPFIAINDGNKQLTYKYWLGSAGVLANPLAVAISTDGVTYTTVYTHALSGTINSVSNTWTENTINLAAYSGQNIGIRFIGTTNYGSGTCNMAIDQVSVADAPTCFVPTALTSSISTGSATISWTAPATGTAPASYNWELRSSGAAGSGATGLVASGVETAPTTSATITSGLTLNTTYTYYVQSNCGGGDLSAWTSNSLLYGYCASTSSYGCADGDVIARIQLNTLDNNSGTGCPSDPVPGNQGIGVNGPGYSDYSTNPLLTTALQAGGSYSCTVSAGQYSEVYAAWVDYNDDFVFSPSERIGFTATPVTGSGVAGVLGSSASFPINLLCNPPLGTHRLRVRCVYGLSSGSSISPCDNVTYGETEDYNIDIITPVSCPAPTAPVASNPTYNSVDLAWTNGCVESAWNVEYGPTGFTPGTGTVVAVTTNPATITGLSSVTTYEFYVSADCGVVDGESAQSPIPASATTPQAPCLGTPDAGTIALSGACSDVSFTLTPTGGTWTDLGLTYVWEASPDGTTWTPTGATSASLTVSQTTATYYHRITTCDNSGLSATTNDLFVTMNAPTACYCVPTTSFGCTDGDVIARVTLNTLDNNSGTGCPSGLAGYSDYTSDPLLTTSLQAGGSYSCTVYAGQYSEGYAAWIDYNDDGTFDNSTERIGYSDGLVAGSGLVGVLGSSESFPISLACNPPLGVHRLRVRAMYFTNGNAVTPCANNSYGEVEDYLVTITTPAPCPAPSALLWTAATSSSVSLAWTAGCVETAWNLEYGPTGHVAGTGTIVSASTNPFTISGLAAETTYDVYVRANCGGSNGVSTWVGPVSATTGCAAAPLTYSQGFNGGAPCWLVNNNVVGTAAVTISTGGSNPTTSPYESTGMLYFNSFNYTSGAKARAISAPLSSLTETSVDVEFQWRNENNPSYTDPSEGVQVQYSLDGTTWTDAGSFVTRHDASLASGAAAWKKKTITLPSACAGQAEFFVGFLFTSDFGDNCFLDAAVVKQTPACPAFTEFTATVDGQTTINVNITGNPGENAIVEYGLEGFTPGTGATAGVGGTVVSTSTLSATLTVLPENTYDIYVRKDCSAASDGYSENTDRVRVNTFAFVPTSGFNEYTTCSGTIYDSAIDGSYVGEGNGYTVVYPASASGILTLSGDYDIDGDWDVLEIYEDAGTGGTLLGTYFGAGTISVQASAPNTPLTIAFTSSEWTAGGAGFALTASCQEVCTDIPSNALLTGNASVCVGEPVGIELVTPEVGLTYIWQKRTSPGAAWELIPGETGAVLNTTQTVNTEYRARLGCIYYGTVGATLPTQSWSVTMNAPSTCYCNPSYTNGTTAGDFIQSVVSGSINNNTGASSSPFYTTYPSGAGTTTTYTQGGQYSITITPGTYTQNDVTAWIDYNQDGSFSSTERLGLALNTGAGAETTFNFTVPSSALLGTTRLRVREADQLTTSIDPCAALSWGETEDYFVTMAVGASNDAPANATVIAPPIYPACLNLSGNLALATDDPLDASTGADLWYSFTAASNACRVVVSGGTATNVEVEIQDSPASSATTVSTVNSQTANGNEILITDDLTSGSTYWVAIRNALGGTPGTFSVCIQTLAVSACDNGPNFASLCSSFKADWTGTSSYTATFTSQDVPGNVYTYTTTNTSYIPLSIVPATVGNVDAGGLQYGESYNVSVSANYNLPDAIGDMQTAVASPSTSTCAISIAPVAGLNMASSYASNSSGSLSTPGSNPRVSGSWIQTDLFVCGAIGYSWSISEVNYLNGTVQPTPFIVNTTSRQVRLWPVNIPTLAAGKRYQVLVAPIFAWGTGSYNTATQRYVQIAGSAGMVEENNNDEVVLVDKSLTTGVFASLYPNPNNGENVNINIAGIESESVNIRIMDASGRTVWSNNFFVEGILATTVSFDRPLAAGIYMVEMNYNGEISTQRMVVQK